MKFTEEFGVSMSSQGSFGFGVWDVGALEGV